MALKTANNQSMTAITALPSAVAKGGMVLLATETASDDTTLSFTSGIDSSYKEYIFKFIDFNPGTDAKSLTFQGSTNSGSSYGVTATTTWFNAYHAEADGSPAIGYSSSLDLAEATGYQPLGYQTGNGADESQAGTLHLYDPSNTTFVKHFIARASNYRSSDFMEDSFIAGYFNTTSAINAIQFKPESGNFVGTIKLYGVT
jgi:hypothetical protein